MVPSTAWGEHKMKSMMAPRLFAAQRAILNVIGDTPPLLLRASSADALQRRVAKGLASQPRPRSEKRPKRPGECALGEAIQGQLTRWNHLWLPVAVLVDMQRLLVGGKIADDTVALDVAEDHRRCAQSQESKLAMA